MTDHLFVIGRITVRAGDFVTILPSSPGTRDGFVGRVKSAKFGLDGVLCEVTVVGARGKKAPAWRTVVASRVRPIRPKQQLAMQQGHRS